MERRFQSVVIAEPSLSDAEEILRGIREQYEAHYRLKILDEAIHAAVCLSARYLSDRFLPDKAIDLMDEAASRVKLREFSAPVDHLDEELSLLREQKEKAINDQDFEMAAKIRDSELSLKERIEKKNDAPEKTHHLFTGQVTAEDIAEIVSADTGIDVSRLTSRQSERLLRLEEELHHRVVGQEEAVSAVSRAIRRGRVGISDPGRPVGSFSFWAQPVWEKRN